MAKNTESIGVVLILVVLAGALNSSSSNTLGKKSIIPALNMGNIMKDFHRMTDVMGKVDSLGQMALSPPKLPEPSKLINTSALPDISGIMDTLGPLLKNMNMGEEK